MIDVLFNRHSLGLGDTEEGKEEGQGETSSPDETDTGPNLGLDLRSGEAAWSAGMKRNGGRRPTQ